LKVAIIAPPWVPIPPPAFGGIESSIYNLAEGLTALGHEVILFAHRDSRVSCRLMPYLDNPSLDFCREADGFMNELSGKYAYARAAYEKVDIIHDHTLFNSHIDIPTVHTVHGIAREANVNRCIELSKNRKNRFVGISDIQIQRYKTLDPSINFVGRVHHGIDIDSVKWSGEKEDFAFFVGRANWAKCIDTALNVSAKARVGLTMAVKIIEEFERDFFIKNIQPVINRHPKDLPLKMHNEVPRDFLFDLFRRAKCTLYTSHWDDPFGHVILESMASGTPVLALRRNTAGELITDGRSGVLVDSEDDMVNAFDRIKDIDPAECRREAEERFSRETVAGNYLNIYKKMLTGK